MLYYYTQETGEKKVDRSFYRISREERGVIHDEQGKKRRESK